MDIDVPRTALLTLYCQNSWVQAVVKSRSRVLDRVAEVQQAAREARLEVMHVGIAFPPGYPVVGPLSNHHELMLKTLGAGTLGTPGAEFHPKVAPKSGEVNLMSQCSGPFVGTPLEQALRARDIRTLIVTGIATAGAVKNFVTDGTNRFFDIAVLRDCCEDGDLETYDVLMNKVFPDVCQVANSKEFLEALAQRKAKR